jgi:hypothetical protein
VLVHLRSFAVRRSVLFFTAPLGVSCGACAYHEEQEG